LEEIGHSFKENSMIPIGYDYGCSSKGCSEKFISINSIYSFDISP